MKLRALLVEDSSDDAELLLRELKRAGFETSSKRVCTPEELSAALAEDWDVVLSDFSMPYFSALDALELVNTRGKDIPFIIVSGSISESEAARAMAKGAHDYFSKT